METDNLRRNNRVLTGIFLVVGGALYMAYQKGAAIPHWIFSWEMLLIVIGLLSGIKHRFRNSGWLILMIVGGVFLLDGEIPNLNFHQYIIPMMVIAVGLVFIFRPRNSRCFGRNRFNRNWSERYKNRWENQEGSWNAASSEDITESGDYIQSTSIFSGVKKVILSKDFKGGSITCVMGGAEIDLSQADINGTVVIRMELVFGGTKLIVPPHWIVNNEIDGVFHGVEDKRRMQPGISADSAKVLILKGSCVFGGIEIKSY